MLCPKGEMSEPAEGARLLSEYTGLNLYRGFKSLSLRHSKQKSGFSRTRFFIGFRCHRPPLCFWRLWRRYEKTRRSKKPCHPGALNLRWHHMWADLRCIKHKVFIAVSVALFLLTQDSVKYLSIFLIVVRNGNLSSCSFNWSIRTPMPVKTTCLSPGLLTKAHYVDMFLH